MTDAERLRTTLVDEEGGPTKHLLMYEWGNGDAWVQSSAYIVFPEGVGPDPPESYGAGRGTSEYE